LNLWASVLFPRNSSLNALFAGLPTNCRTSLRRNAKGPSWIARTHASQNAYGLLRGLLIQRACAKVFSGDSKASDVTF